MNQQPNANGYPYAQQSSPYPAQPQEIYGQQRQQMPAYPGRQAPMPMQQPATPPSYAPQQPVQRGYTQPQGYQQQFFSQPQSYAQGGMPPQSYPPQQNGMQPQSFPNPQSTAPQQGYPQQGFPQQSNTQPQQAPYPQQQLQPGYTTHPQPKVYPYPQQPTAGKNGYAVLDFLKSVWNTIQERGLLLPAIALALGFAYALYITIVFFTSYHMNLRVLPHLLAVWASVAVNGAACAVQKRTYVTVAAGAGYLVAMLLFLNHYFLLIPSIVLCAFDYFFPQQRS